MGNPYSSVSVSDYNTNPPSDDGSQTVANSVTWAKHKVKLGDPLKDAIENINTNILAAFLTNIGAVTTGKPSNYTALEADRGKLFKVTNETTITALAAATAGDGFINGALNSNATDVVTVTGSGSEKIGGEDNIFLYPGESIWWVCDGANNQILIDNRDKTRPGTIVFGVFSVAEPGYILCTGGTIGNSSSGATTAKEYTKKLFNKVKDCSPNNGTEDFDSNDSVTLPDMRGRALAGNDDLGGSSAGTVTAANADTLGGLVGTETQAASGSVGTTGSTSISEANLPSSATATLNGEFTSWDAGSLPSGGTTSCEIGTTNPPSASNNVTTVSYTLGSLGSGTGHTHSGGSFAGSPTNIVQPTFFCGAQIKL